MTPEQVAAFASLGWTDAQIGQQFGKSRRQVLEFRKRNGIAGRPVGPNAKTQPVQFMAGMSGVQSQPIACDPILTIPPAPFAVPMASPARGMAVSGVTKAVVYGDVHYPFQDDKALAVVLGIIKDVQPDVIVNVGDLVDCWQISRFDKDPTRKDDLQESIDAARAHLHQVAQVAPTARRVLLEGNHEDRLTRAICGLDGVQRELAKLRAFQDAMTWPVLLGLDEIGWEWVSGRIQSKTPILPKLITKHGTVVRKWSGTTARGEWEKYGASGLSGHTHRLGHFLHRDHNGTASWIETGCCCLLDPPYGSDFDWQQGCVVLTWSADHRLMNTEIVSMRDGAALYRGKEYTA